MAMCCQSASAPKARVPPSRPRLPTPASAPSVVGHAVAGSVVGREAAAEAEHAVASVAGSVVGHAVVVAGSVVGREAAAENVAGHAVVVAAESVVGVRLPIGRPAPWASAPVASGVVALPAPPWVAAPSAPPAHHAANRDPHPVEPSSQARASGSPIAVP